MPAFLWIALVLAPQWIVVSPPGARGRPLSHGLAQAPPGWERCRVVAAVPRGEMAELDPWLEPTSASLGPNDSAFVAGLQWGLGAVGAPEAWGRTTGGDDLRLAVLDTGVDPAHPDLQDVSDPRGTRLTAWSSVAGSEADVADSLGHGTMVCGVMAARTNNSVGMAGMAGGDGVRGPRLLSVKITSGKGGAARASDLARAIVLACEWGARAINVSFAGSARSSILRSALSWAAARGVVVVCGAGNTADDREQFPAAYAAAGIAVSVTASEKNGGPAPFDTRGDWIDGAAPGVDVFSTWPGYANAFASPLRDYAVSAGTSFAAPLVTGLAGLVVSLDSSLAAGDFRELFRRTLRRTAGDSWWHGVADAPALLAALSPPYRMSRGVAVAESWREDGPETLRVRGSAFWRAAGAADGDYPARRYEVQTTIRDAPPLDAAVTWVRSVGEGGWRPGALRDGEECWGEPVGGDEIRTFVYLVDGLGWMPRAPWEVALPWTRWGREATVAAAPGGPRLESISAVPARGAIVFRVTGSVASTVTVFDVRGRGVARLALRAGTATWQGKDEAGRIAPAGMYFARCARAVTRFVWVR